MAKQARTKRRPPSRKGKGPTPTSWKPGQSGNPRGRPRSGLAFAERVRERVDPDLVIDLAMRVAEDEELTATERLAALWPLIDRGFIKPPQTLAATVTAHADASFDVTALPLDEQRKLLELIQRARDATEAQRQLLADLELLGMRTKAGAKRKRRGHDLRRTFITLARTDGAIDGLLRWVTHGPSSDMMDVYSSPPWEALCAEVAKLKISLLDGAMMPLATDLATGPRTTTKRWRKVATPTGFEPVLPA